MSFCSLWFCCTGLHIVAKGSGYAIWQLTLCMCINVGSCLAFDQVALAVEGSTMSGSLQRRKKSKRKWKRLWFLLKDKVLYTFTACEVRGHRVSHTSPKTLMIIQSQRHFFTVFVYPLFSSPLANSAQNC